METPKANYFPELTDYQHAIVDGLATRIKDEPHIVFRCQTGYGKNYIQAGLLLKMLTDGILSEGDTIHVYVKASLKEQVKRVYECMGIAKVFQVEYLTIREQPEYETKPSFIIFDEVARPATIPTLEWKSC